jgi:TRAP-type C4-dicarboxylate transport system substrate-binding protein
MDDHGRSANRHGRRSVSFFAAGLLLGMLLSTVGFGLFLRLQKTAERNAVLAGGGGGGQKQIVLKLGHALDTGHPVHAAMEHMAARLTELSGGAVSIDIYPSAVLGSEVQCLEQVQNGSLDMTKVSAAVMENFAIGAALLEKGEPKLLRGLCYYDSGSRNFYTRSKPIRTPEDLEGLKIRVMNSATAIAMVKAMGGAPKTILRASPRTSTTRCPDTSPSTVTRGFPTSS